MFCASFSIVFSFWPHGLIVLYFLLQTDARTLLPSYLIGKRVGRWDRRFRLSVFGELQRQAEGLLHRSTFFKSSRRANNQRLCNTEQHSRTKCSNPIPNQRARSTDAFPAHVRASAPAYGFGVSAARFPASAQAAVASAPCPADFHASAIVTNALTARSSKRALSNAAAASPAFAAASLDRP